MKIYKIGKTITQGSNYIILESNYTGEIIYTATPKSFAKDKICKVFVFHHINDYTNSLYGFATIKDRSLFENLLGVPGIGPKTALSMMTVGSEKIIQYISSRDIESLGQVPSMGKNSANRIIMELHDKYSKGNKQQPEKNSVINKDVIESLKILGFNKEQIAYAMSNITETKSVDKAVEEAIKLISSVKFAQAPKS